MRSERWRYIRYADGSQELYDMESDPHEWRNLASDPRVTEVIREHARWLPKPDVDGVPGSASRVLAGTNGVWYWEGRRVRPEEAEK